MPRVLKRKGFRAPIPKGAVYVGRPSKWGTPKGMLDPKASAAERRILLRKYRAYITQRIREEPERYDLEELRGKDLVCYCAPLPCHADVLMEMANGERR